MFFNQTPFFPELLFQADDFNFVKEIHQNKPHGLINSKNFTDDDLNVFKYTFSQDGAPKAAINYYRAMLQNPQSFSQTELSTPVLLLWAFQDQIFGEELADASSKYCSDIRVKKIINSSRWIHQDVPDMVNKYIDIFLKETQDIEHNYDF